MECERLLEKARDVLTDYWFSSDGEDNNRDVIEVSREIDDYFCGISTHFNEEGEKNGKAKRAKG